MRRVLTVLAAVPFSVAALAGCGQSDLESATSQLAGSADRLPTAYVYDLNSACGERNMLGDFRISVVDGTVTDVEPLGDTQMNEMTIDTFPTLDDLIGIVENSEPDAEIELEVNADGIPTSIDIDHVPEAIDDEECYRVTNVQVSNAER